MTWLMTLIKNLGIAQQGMSFFVSNTSTIGVNSQVMLGDMMLPKVIGKFKETCDYVCYRW